jgi:hypothetical protein
MAADAFVPLDTLLGRLAQQHAEILAGKLEPRLAPPVPYEGRPDPMSRYVKPGQADPWPHRSRRPAFDPREPEPEGDAA